MARRAILDEGILTLGGGYGDCITRDPTEYDDLRIVASQGTVRIRVYNRRMLLRDRDDRVRRIHRVLCRLTQEDPAVADPLATAQKVGLDSQPLLPPGGFTYRDHANVLTLLAFRNGPIENLHAGKSSALLEDPELSRITDEEMKTLMIAASAKLAELLVLRDSNPDAYARLLAEKWPHVRHWER